MILDKYVKVKINPSNYNYLLSKGYENFKTNDIISVKVEDLSNGSNVLVNCKCDICGLEKKLNYRFYLKNIKKYNIFTCYKCSKIKVKKTSLENYGVDNPLKSNLIKDKIKETFIKNYGVDNPSKIKEFQEKRKDTIIKKFGNESFFKSDYFMNNVKYYRTYKNDVFFNYLKENFIKKYNLNLLDYNKNNNNLIFHCDIHDNYEISSDTLFKRLEVYKTNPCIFCNPLFSNTQSENEKMIYIFIKNNYNGEIILNDRHLGKELDIYIPELKLAFEFNGLWWHNELYKEINYHIDKTELCEENGIQLIHIWEDDWLYKQDIVKSMILNKLCKTPNKIYARKTEIKEITDNKLVREFLDKNHIQGFVGSKIKIGLFHEGELVSLMTFGKKRLGIGNINNNEINYELLRFCNKIFTNIVGGASKLFKYFIKNYKPEKIITYADRSYSNGELYNKIGFNYLYKTEPNYYYVINNIRKHRFNFRKDKLIREGYEPELTEHQIMLNRKIYRIYNSGNLKFINYCNVDCC